MAKYFQTFKAKGQGYFPLDMLRYDYCWPRTPDSVSDIGLSLETGYRGAFAEVHGENPSWSIELAREVERKDIEPTIARWRSFGWTVSNIETRRV